jgi:hypothetical protein
MPITLLLHGVQPGRILFLLIACLPGASPILEATACYDPRFFAPITKD